MQHKPAAKERAGAWRDGDRRPGPKLCHQVPSEGSIPTLGEEIDHLDQTELGCQQRGLSLLDNFFPGQGALVILIPLVDKSDQVS